MKEFFNPFISGSDGSGGGGGEGGTVDAYTKAQTDAMLNKKADKANVYTKTETDAAITEQVSGIVTDISELQKDSHTHSNKAILDSITQEQLDKINAHNQPSSTITSMAGYSKPLSSSPILETDSLNTAIGKLEKAIEDKEVEGNYAGSSTNGGPATSAEKLSNTEQIGTNKKPVYFSADGVPVAIDHTINSDVPENAKFTDTKYSAGTGIRVADDTMYNMGVLSVNESATNGCVDFTIGKNGAETSESKTIPVHGLGDAAYKSVDTVITEDSANLITSRAVSVELDKKMNSSMRNSADGVAGLDGNSKINVSQIPTTDEYNVESAYPVTSKAVEAAMNTLPNPMLYKGSLGTGGTITALPTASASNEGFTYKVITSGTYAGQSAKVGDVFISNGTEWTIIPSGDEPEGTVISVGMSVPTGLKIKDGTSPVTTSGTIEVQLDEGYVIPKEADIVPSTRKINNITLESDVVLDGDDIKATGYVKAGSKSNITGTDTINQALGKLELKSDTNETNISTLVQGLAKKADASTVSALSETVATKADSSTVSAISDRVSATETEQEAISARMDTFTKLSEGSTTGDAELADGRVGSDGKTYDNIGGAIRGQVTDLKSDIANVVNNDNLLLKAELFENKYYAGSFMDDSAYSVFVLPVEANVSYKFSLAPRWFYVDNTSIPVTGNLLTPTVSGTAYITVYNSDRENWAMCTNDKDITKVGTYDEPVAKDSFVKNVMKVITSKADKTEMQEFEYEISKKQNAIFKKKDLSLYFESGFINTSMNVYDSTAGKHIIINVVEGEQYEISGTSNNSDYQGAWLALDNTLVQSLYHGTSEEFSNIIVTIPEGVNKLIVNGNNTKTDLSACKLDMVTSEDFSETSADDFELKALEKRVLRAEKNNDFAWKEFDKAYFVFVHDDTNAFLSTALDIFKSKNVPLSSAVIIDYLNTVPIGQTKTIEELLHDLIDNGGEVLAHYDASLTQDMSDEVWYENTVKPLKVLTEKGFDVNGILMANQTSRGTEKGENICRKYYRYSDGLGSSLQYSRLRQGIGGFSVDRFKQFVDESCSEKGFFPICFHGLRESEIVATEENLGIVIDYIKSKGDLAEITTYKSVFDRFGSTVLEERISALEKNT